MFNKIKWVDWGMLTLFVLWLGTVDFNRMTILNWVTGGVMVAYLIYFAVKRIRGSDRQ